MTINKITKIKKSEYKKLKENYMSKNRNLHSLFVDFNKKKMINRDIFLELINNMRKEEGYPNISFKKKKRKNNEFKYVDKHQNNYKTGKDYIN